MEDVKRMEVWQDSDKVCDFKRDHSDTIMILHPHFNGCHYLLLFGNGYGVSIVRHDGSYGHERGLYEMAVISHNMHGDWNLTYDTPITDDVIGYITMEEALEKAEEVFNLK